MDVMMTIAEMGFGGAETVVATLARQAMRNGYHVTLASSGGWRADEMADDGARCVRTSLAGRRPRDLAASVLTLRRQPRPDVIHAHNVKCTAVSRAAFPGGRHVPIVSTLHGVPEGQYRATARVLRRCADSVVAVSEDVAERVISAGLPSQRVRVIENAVLAPVPHDRRDARARLGFADDIPVVLCVARLVPQKRHDLLVAAWRYMPRNAQLLIAGDGPTRSDLEIAIRDGAAGDRIRLLGERGDVDWLLAAADVLVLPTDWEGMPISVLEAMAAGVPVVASAVNGVLSLGAEAVERIPANEVAALAHGLTHVLSDPLRRRSLVAAGTRLTDERFSTERMWSDYRELYEAQVRQTRAHSQAEAGEDS